MVRLAKWHHKLGHTKDLRGPPKPTPLSCILNDGGTIGVIKVWLARVYPLIYLEKNFQGKNVMRSERAHLRRIQNQSSHHASVMDQVLKEAETENEKRNITNLKRLLSLNKKEISNLNNGEEISFILENYSDPSTLQGVLDQDQVNLAQQWRQQQNDLKRERIQNEVKKRLKNNQQSYEATPMLKICVVDKNLDVAQITIWRPSNDLVETIKEGSAYSIQYLNASDYSRSNILQLTATKQTRWISTSMNADLPDSLVCRKVTPLCLFSSEEVNCSWGEVDVVGLVFRVDNDNCNRDMVYIVDHHTNILKIRFWGGLQESGVQNLLIPGAKISACNCSWRVNQPGEVSATQITTFSTSPKRPYLVEALQHLKSSIQDASDLIFKANMKLDGNFNSNQETSIAELDEQFKHDESFDKNNLQNLSDDSYSNKTKIKLLQQKYSTPSPLRNLNSPSSSLSRKPFKTPFKS